MSFLLIGLIRLYQLTLSKLLVMLLGPVCRFEPSCSRYALACIQGQGAFRGSLLSAKRLCRCHPFNPGGYDPPPPPRRPLSGSSNPSFHGTTTGREVLLSAPPFSAPPFSDTTPHPATQPALVESSTRGASNITAN